MSKEIFVVFSATPYKVGKIIRMVTGEKYNHASIALDKNLTQMYSFARRYHETPLYSGFVKESSVRYCKNGTRASVIVYKLEVSEARYNAVAERLEAMYQNREQYLYNHLSAMIVPFHKNIPLKDAYTCVEFCVEILRMLGIRVKPGKYYAIKDLMEILRPYAFYSGPMPCSRKKDPEYLKKKPLEHPFQESVKSITKLLPRVKRKKK